MNTSDSIAGGKQSHRAGTAINFKSKIIEKVVVNSPTQSIDGK